MRDSLMRYALIDRNGLVVRIVEGNPDDPPTFENYRTIPSETATVGDKFEGDELVAQSPAPPRQFRQ